MSQSTPTSWFSKTIYKTHTHTHLVKIAATLRLSRRDKATQIFLFCMNSKCRLRWRRQLDKKEKTTLKANVWTSPASCPWSSRYTDLMRLCFLYNQAQSGSFVRSGPWLDATSPCGNPQKFWKNERCVFKQSDLTREAASSKGELRLQS